MSFPADVQFPAASALRRILPTLTGFTVTKFEPATKHEEEEAVKDENGAKIIINGIDLTYYYDVEMVVHPSSAEPGTLTQLTFTAPTASNAIAIPGTASGNIVGLIRGEVKHIGNAGETAKIGFKLECNVNGV